MEEEVILTDQELTAYSLTDRQAEKALTKAIEDLVKGYVAVRHILVPKGGS